MLRVSLVKYLNAAPLGWSFLRGPLRGTATVLQAVPSRCAGQLAGREVDVGLIPSIEYQRIPELTVVPGIAIASTSAVRSVLLVKPRGRTVRSVALDTSSRTSVALARILLRFKYGLEPSYVPHAPDLGKMLQICDAALLIGDAALRVSFEEYEVMDLAEEWIEWQERPFVWAFWACRPGLVDAGETSLLLNEAKAWGLERRDEIAAVYSRRLRLPKAFLLAYLHNNIDFDLTARHLEGLERFYGLAAEAGFLPEVCPVRFAAQPTELPATLG